MKNKDFAHRKTYDARKKMYDFLIDDMTCDQETKDQKENIKKHGFKTKELAEWKN